MCAPCAVALERDASVACREAMREITPVYYKGKRLYGAAAQSVAQMIERQGRVK